MAPIYDSGHLAAFLVFTTFQSGRTRIFGLAAAFNQNPHLAAKTVAVTVVG